ncbi:MAG: polysaccharide deacetylase family protein [Myxococcales bacterium]|nr:polysaccharide deacetylase family protein [Myxococcales bacterium]MCB9651738.1 polysaccharide deacetylase family protein [Deltaproteobacteria bacterium]
MSPLDRIALVGLALCAAALALGGPGPALWAVGLFALVVLGLLLDGVFRPASVVLMPVLVRGDRRSGCVALTFDDGPDPEVTPQILDALAAAGAKATFFAIGRHLEAHPALARRLVDEGHELGNHSFSHSRLLNFARDGAMEAEVRRGAAAVVAVSGQPGLPLYRPPIGLKNPPLARVARRLAMRVVMWSVHGRDTGAASGAAVAERVLGRAGPGDIVLLHDGRDAPGPARRATAEAVPLILAGLAARGLRPVTVSALLAASPQEAPPDSGRAE